ncbi:unnamed protein product [Ambrosiozyma monospora]|uniref:Unnamed protein product n=1 Tax=Ambrosiozyma monospora TaxID=43982 RepID=A0ACB5T9U1_AMBMO|nr:unnamed protein product [Ambrosiozyma monospora]
MFIDSKEEVKIQECNKSIFKRHILSILFKMLRSLSKQTLVFSRVASVKLQPSLLSKTQPFSTYSLLRNEVDTHKFADTVILPTTSFPSRSNASLIEKQLKPQCTSDLYKWNISRPTNGKLENVFILHDGPPYANGDLHVGHSLNKVLKDIINRFELMKGKIVHYKPGWDCHGLPIELKTLEKLSKVRKEEEKSIKKKLKKLDKSSEEYQDLHKHLEDLRHTKLSPLDIVKLSEHHALEAQANQSKTFQKLGIMGDFENPYLTLKKPYVIEQLKIFKKFFNNKMVKRQRKPVYWGCETATALAEGELEYNKEHVSKTAYVRFPIVSFPESIDKQHLSEDIDALIWTSTPWTLLANRAISINKKMQYTILRSSNGQRSVLVAVELADSILSIDLSLMETDIIIEGADLVGTKYVNPLLNDPSTTFPVIAGDHVTNTAGTGLVHTAPGHGHDDYLVGLANNIEVYSPVDDHGKYTSDLHPNVVDEFKGLKVLGAGNDKVLEKLEQLDILFHRNDNYVHSYPYDWRSKKPIIIRATPQWFIDCLHQE